MCLYRGIQQQDAMDSQRAKGTADMANPAPGSSGAEGSLLLHGADTASLHAGQSGQQGLQQRYDSRQYQYLVVSSCCLILQLLQAQCTSITISEFPVMCRTASGQVQISTLQPESEPSGIGCVSTAPSPLLAGSQLRGSQLRGRLAGRASLQMGLGSSVTHTDALVQ